MTTYNVIMDTSFLGADTAYGTNGVPSFISVDNIYPPGTVGGQLRDARGDFWAITSHQLVSNATVTGVTAGNNFNLQWPIADKQLQQQIIVNFICPAGATNFELDIFLRDQANVVGGTAGYTLRVFRANFQGAWHNSNSIANGTDAATSYTLTAGVEYIVTFTAFSPSAGNTTITYSIADKPTGNIFATHTESGAFSGIIASVHNAGTWGIGINPLVSLVRPVITRIQLLYASSSNLNCNASTLQQGSNSQGLVLTGTGTNWLTSLPTFAYSGVAGLTQQGATSFISDTKAIVYVNVPGGTSGSTLTITDPSLAAPNTATLSVTTQTGVNPTLDLPTPVAADATHVSLTANPAYGGLAPYTYQWYRGPRTGAATSTWAVGDANVATLSGQTSLTMLDAPGDSRVYTYRCVATDSAAKVKATQACPGVVGYTAPANVSGYTGTAALHLGMMGDSYINHAPADGSSTLFVQFLAQVRLRLANATTPLNAGQAGRIITNFAPNSGASPNYYSTDTITTPTSTLIAAITSTTTTLMTLQIGYNDSQAAETAATYLTSLNDIAASLAVDRPTVRLMVHYPSYRSDGDGSRNNLVLAYCDSIDTAVAGNANLIAGDHFGIMWTAMYPNWDDGIHGNGTWTTAMAQLQGTAITAKQLPGTGGGGAGNLPLSLAIGIGF